MQYRRNFQPGGTFFFTVVTYGRLPIFRDPRACELLRSAVADVRKRRPFAIDAAVVLDDHLHMVWRLPAGDAGFSRRWAHIKGAFTRQWLAAGGREATPTDAKRRAGRRGVWQPKFYEHTIRDEDDYRRHIEYIHYNPVKHGYVDAPRDWAASSFHQYVKRGDYPLDWCTNGSRPASALGSLPTAFME